MKKGFSKRASRFGQEPQILLKERDAFRNAFELLARSNRSNIHESFVQLFLKDTVEKYRAWLPPVLSFSSSHSARYGPVSGRQFLWGVGLQKGNGGVQRFPQDGRRLALECKSRRELDCKTHLLPIQRLSILSSSQNFLSIFHDIMHVLNISWRILQKKLSYMYK